MIIAGDRERHTSIRKPDKRGVCLITIININKIVANQIHIGEHQLDFLSLSHLN